MTVAMIYKSLVFPLDQSRTQRENVHYAQHMEHLERIFARIRLKKNKNPQEGCNFDLDQKKELYI